VRSVARDHTMTCFLVINRSANKRTVFARWNHRRFTVDFSSGFYGLTSPFSPTEATCVSLFLRSCRIRECFPERVDDVTQADYFSWMRAISIPRCSPFCPIRFSRATREINVYYPNVEQLAVISGSRRSVLLMTAGRGEISLTSHRSR